MGGVFSVLIPFLRGGTGGASGSVTTGEPAAATGVDDVPTCVAGAATVGFLDSLSGLTGFALTGGDGLYWRSE